MSTPTEKRVDLLIRNLWKIKHIAFWTMNPPTFNGNRKQSFFPVSATRRRNTSKPVWTIAVTSLPLWLFHVMECAWKWSQGSTAKPASPRNQESSPTHSEKLWWSQRWANIAIVRAMHATEDHASPLLWAEWANIPSGKMKPALAYSTIWSTTNIFQNWTTVTRRK